MSTVIRPELSTNHEYYIPKHRYYELKHFCLQYPTWKKLYADLAEARYPREYWLEFSETHYADKTAGTAIALCEYSYRICMVEQACIKTDPELKDYILQAVTEGRSFTYMKTVKEVPCEKDTWYDRYRRFFWILDKSRK